MRASTRITSLYEFPSISIFEGDGKPARLKIIQSWVISIQVEQTMAWTPTLARSLLSWLQWPSRTTARHVLIGVLIGFSFSLTSTSLAVYYQQRKRERQIGNFSARPIEVRSDEIVKGVAGLIGWRPLPRKHVL